LFPDNVFLSNVDIIFASKNVLESKIYMILSRKPYPLGYGNSKRESGGSLNVR